MIDEQSGPVSLIRWTGLTRIISNKTNGLANWTILPTPIVSGRRIIKSIIDGEQDEIFKSQFL